MTDIPPLPDDLADYERVDLPAPGYLAPNLCLQSALFGMIRRGHREMVENKVIASFSNVKIYYTGAELEQSDLDVWLHALCLASNQKFALVEFNARSYLRALGRQPGTSGRKWLLRSIRRLTACYVEVQMANCQFGTCIYGGSLIYDFYYDPVKKKFYLRINNGLGDLFRCGWTPLQWCQRLSLKTGLAKWLHGFYFSVDIYPIYVVSIRSLSRSKCARLSKFRTLLKAALQELIEAKAIKEWRIDKDDKLHVVK